MEEWLIQYINNHAVLAYIPIMLFSLLLGPAIGMIGGFFLQVGTLSFIPLYAALMIGDIIGDTVWYFVGKKYGDRFVGTVGKYFNVTEHNVQKMKHLYHRHHSSILIVSKITNAFGLAIVTLATAGMVNIPFRRYMVLNLIGQFIWSGALIALGYFFGHLYAEIDRVFGWATAFGATVVGFILLFGLYSYAKHEFLFRLNRKGDNEGN